MSKAVTRVAIISEGTDPLESVRRSVAFADAMIAEGATVTVTGDLSFNVRFDIPCDDCGRTDGTHDPDVEH